MARPVFATVGLVCVLFILDLTLLFTLLMIIFNPGLGVITGIPKVFISSASASSFNLSASAKQLSSNFDINISIHNGDKYLNIHHSLVEVSILDGYRNNSIATAAIPDFSNAKKATTMVQAKILVVSQSVDDDVVRGIFQDKKKLGGGEVKFQVKVRGRAMFSLPGWWSWWNYAGDLSAECYSVWIRFQDATAMAGATGGPPTKCHSNYLPDSSL